MNDVTKPHHPSSQSTTWVWPAVFILVPLVLGCISVLLGKDVNWDLRNYHYYDAYAFLQHRLGVDLAPAQRQTYFNPLLDLPFYYLVRHYPAWVAGFVLGALHGLSFPLVFLIAWLAIDHGRKPWGFAVAGAVAVMAVIAPGFLSELGNTMNDNLTSLFVLSALTLVLHATGTFTGPISAPTAAEIAGAGLIMGVGVGLKPTAAALAIGAGIALATVRASWIDRFRLVAAYAVAGAIGIVLAAGFWWRELYLRYANPVLPYYNNVFRSPFAAPYDFVPRYFMPQHLWEYFAWPVLFSLNSYRVNELKFTDIRFALLYLLCLAAVAIITIKRLARRRVLNRRRPNLFTGQSGSFLFIFLASSFAIWMAQSSEYRFIIPLELLVPICGLWVLDQLIPSRKWLLALALLSAITTLAFFKPFDWGRTPWSDPYISIRSARLDLSRNTLVVMLGSSPMSYVIPQFPSTYRFVRPEADFILGDQDRTFTDIRDLLRKYEGPLFVLYVPGDQALNLERSAARLGIEIHAQDCFVLHTNMPDNLHMCSANPQELGK